MLSNTCYKLITTNTAHMCTCVCICVCVCVCVDAEGNSTKERRKDYFSGIISVSKSYYE